MEIRKVYVDMSEVDIGIFVADSGIFNIFVVELECSAWNNWCQDWNIFCCDWTICCRDLHICCRCVEIGIFHVDMKIFSVEIE